MSDWYGYLCDDARAEPNDPEYRRVQPRARVRNPLHPELGSYQECKWPASARYRTAHTVAVYDAETGGEPKVQLPMNRTVVLYPGDAMCWTWMVTRG